MGEEAAGKRWVRGGCIRRGSGGAGQREGDGGKLVKLQVVRALLLLPKGSRWFRFLRVPSHLDFCSFSSSFSIFWDTALVVLPVYLKK